MKETCVNVLSRPELEKPWLVVGLPGIGNVGKRAAQLLVELTHAELFAELYSPSFPDLVLIDKDGLCRPPRYEFHASTSSNLMILTGDAQPQLEDVTAHHEVCGKILNFVAELGCRFIVTVEGIPLAETEKAVYVAATSKKLLAKYLEQKATPYKGDRIVGGSGILLGLAKLSGLEGVCLIGSVSDITDDQEAAFKVLKLLRRIVGPTLKEGP